MASIFGPMVVKKEDVGVASNKSLDVKAIDVDMYRTIWDVSNRGSMESLGLHMNKKLKKSINSV